MVIVKVYSILKPKSKEPAALNICSETLCRTCPHKKVLTSTDWSLYRCSEKYNLIHARPWVGGRYQHKVQMESKLDSFRADLTGSHNMQPAKAHKTEHLKGSQLGTFPHRP